jgi:hypothetical protein
VSQVLGERVTVVNEQGADHSEQTTGAC